MIIDYPIEFFIVGNKIVNAEGAETVFRGVNIMDPAWLETVYNKLNDQYFSMLTSWNVKIIRIPIHPSSYNYYGSKGYLELLDKTLVLAAAYKIYAIIDFHSIGFPPQETFMELKGPETAWGRDKSIYAYTDRTLKKFWEDIAKHYEGDHRVVFYEIFNEIVKGEGLSDFESWMKWKLKAEEIIDLIREIDSSAKIMVNGMDWAYDVSFAGKNPIDREGIVYGTHPYPNKEKSFDKAFGDLKDKYPIFASEFGFEEAVKGEPYCADARYGLCILDYLESKKIGWTAWNFSPVGWHPNLLIDWDSSYVTSVSGKIFRDFLIQNEMSHILQGKCRKIS